MLSAALPLSFVLIVFLILLPIRLICAIHVFTPLFPLSPVLFV
jgi:hypothetical protein